MKRYEATSLWKNTLSTQLPPDTEEKNRSYLRSAYENFRERAKLLAGEIARDLPEFTVHDITHIDALWEMAELIAGPDYPLTPTEAFVLGGAFLIHDLGMGLAAYPKGLVDLTSSVLWIDKITALFKQHHHRNPTLDEINNPPENIKTEVLHYVLRELHAKHSECLALISWKDIQNPKAEYFLINDTRLRNAYGPIIGKIAHSHWWNAKELIRQFPHPMGALAGFNNTWTVDPLKIACILRVADASHLDERRAPGFLSALRKTSGESANHWIFQEKLCQPRIESDRLIYTSKSSFPVEQAISWWTCFDSLQMVDAELRQIDSLLTIQKRPTFRAKGVSYVEDPSQMASVIGTTNWIPIDSKIKVGNVAKLISKLGGDKLYGQNQSVPLRELIQNAADAIKARRLLENHQSHWGDVTIRAGKDTTGDWIEVEDNGIGMSEDVLTGPFLDFGNSFWGSSLMHKELPGLESRGFFSTGEFGIGFFSVFMWGEKVQIITRRPERARDETLLLEFSEGLNVRPLLRKATSSECLVEGGTRIRIWFKNSEAYEQMIFGREFNKPWNIYSRCAWLCPSLDVNLYVESESKKLVVSAFDWITISVSELIHRIHGPVSEDSSQEFQRIIEEIEPTFRDIRNSIGDVIGRATISLEHLSRLRSVHSLGIVTVGGFRSSDLHGICGILCGTPYTASRDTGIPIVESETIKNWASDQAQILHKRNFSSEKQKGVASIIRALGGETNKLHIAENSIGWVSAEDIIKDYSEDIFFIISDMFSPSRRDKSIKVKLKRKNLFVTMTSPQIILRSTSDILVDVLWPSSCEKQDFPIDVEEFYFSKSLDRVLTEVFAKKWDLSVEQLYKSNHTRQAHIEIGTSNGKPITETVTVISKLWEGKVGGSLLD